MEAQESVKAMRALEFRRLEVLRKNEGRDSEEEDALLEEMDDAWWRCSYAERTYLNQVRPYHDETVALLNSSEVE